MGAVRDCWWLQSLRAALIHKGNNGMPRHVSCRWSLTWVITPPHSPDQAVPAALIYRVGVRSSAPSTVSRL